MDPDKYIPPTKMMRGILYSAPSPVYPDVYVPVVLDTNTIQDMSMGDLCDAMKACFYSEPGGTDTRRCAKLLAAIHESFKHSSY